MSLTSRKPCLGFVNSTECLVVHGEYIWTKDAASLKLLNLNDASYLGGVVGSVCCEEYACGGDRGIDGFMTKYCVGIGRGWLRYIA